MQKDPSKFRSKLNRPLMFYLQNETAKLFLPSFFYWLNGKEMLSSASHIILLKVKFTIKKKTFFYLIFIFLFFSTLASSTSSSLTPTNTTTPPSPTAKNHHNLPLQKLAHKGKDLTKK